MQPKHLALTITLVPILVSNASYVMSEQAGLVPNCITYLEGCTSISRSARQGDAIFLFRAAMIMQAVLLMAYWKIASMWFVRVSGSNNLSNKFMLWFGVIGAFFLVLYADFLGTDGQMYRYMRRYGVIFFFTFTPFAQILFISQLHKLNSTLPTSDISIYVLRFKLALILLMFALGFTSLGISYSGNSTFEIENIVEWNFMILLSLFPLGSFWLWKNLTFNVGESPNV